MERKREKRRGKEGEGERGNKLLYASLVERNLVVLLSNKKYLGKKFAF